MYTRDAVNALVIALRYPPTRVPAAIALLDRGWGKPDINVHTKSEQTVLHLVAAMEQGDDLLQQLSKPPQIEGKADDTAPTE